MINPKANDICPNCGDEIEEQYYNVCKACYDVVGLFGDEENDKLWKGAKLLVNSECSQESITALADAPAFQQFIRELIDAMPNKTQFILNEAKKLTGE